MRCPTCGSPVMVRKNSWECGYCCDCGNLPRPRIVLTVDVEEEPQLTVEGLAENADPDTALLLLDKSKIKVDDKGIVTGTEEALKDLQSSKAYLFAAQPTGQKGIVGGKIDNPNPGGEPDGVTAAFLRRNPGMKL